MFKILIGVVVLLIVIINNTSSSYSAFTDVSNINVNYISVGSIVNSTSNSEATILDSPTSYTVVNTNN